MSQPISTVNESTILANKKHTYTTPLRMVDCTVLQPGRIDKHDIVKCAKLYSITIALTVKHKAYLIILYTHAHLYTFTQPISEFAS